MLKFFASQWGQVLSLIAVCLAVMIPNLGTPSLWDVDEGVNAECSREMREIGTWIVPTFNYELRTAKPVMLYWLQRFSYNLFGVSEFSARLPAVLCSIISVLAVSALGRRMFDQATGLLAGLILATSIEFCKLAHAATPDAPLICFVSLTFYLFYRHLETGRWFYWAPIPCALAVLTKGPAYLGLIGLPILLFMIFTKRWRSLFDRRLITGLLIFLAIAVPWFAAVGAETRGQFLREFFYKENIGRFADAMEGHNGAPLYQAYYIVILAVFFAPWSVFIGGTLWNAVKQAKQVEALKLLLAWFGVIFFVTSIMSTKLPNYIGTLYPAIALLTAYFLMQWRLFRIQLPGWYMPMASVLVMLTGLLFFVGLLIASGSIPIKGVSVYPALTPFAGFGLILTLGGLGMIYFLKNNDRGGMLASLMAATVLFVGVTAAFTTVAFDQYKAAKYLVEQSGAKDHDHDIRLGSFGYTQPSVTFYAERKVERLETEKQLLDFLNTPRKCFVFMKEEDWPRFEKDAPKECRIIAKKYDLYHRREIAVICNMP